MLYKIKEWPRQIRQGFQSLFLWLPVIWKDRNWDHIYIYIVLRHKLHLTEQLIRHHGHHTKHVQDADKIKLCINLLDRLTNDEYHNIAFKNHYKKWGEPEFNWKDSKSHPGYSELDINYPKVKTDNENGIERKDFKRCSHHEAKLREQDLDLLFKLIRKNIQTWWD